MNFSINNSFYTETEFGHNSVSRLNYDKTETEYLKSDLAKNFGILFAILLHISLVGMIATKAGTGTFFGKGIGETNVISISLVRGLSEKIGGGNVSGGTQEASILGFGKASIGDDKLPKTTEPKIDPVLEKNTENKPRTDTITKTKRETKHSSSKVNKNTKPTAKKETTIKQQASTKETKPVHFDTDPISRTSLKAFDVSSDKTDNVMFANQASNGNHEGKSTSGQTSTTDIEASTGLGNGNINGGKNGFGNTGNGESPQPRPIRIGFGDSNGPRIIKTITPKYPNSAKRMGIEGTVLLKLHLDENGELVDLKVIQSASPLLDEEAIRVAKRSKYAPAKIDGSDAACVSVLPIQFKLKS